MYSGYGMAGDLLATSAPCHLLCCISQAVLLALGTKSAFFFFSTTIDMISFTTWSCCAPRHHQGTSLSH
jgi:hypothetical protein